MNVWDVSECPSGVVDQRGLGDQKGSWKRRTLRVVFQAELSVDVIVGCSGPGERGEDDSMREGDAADL